MALAVAALGAALAWGFWVEPGRLTVDHYDLPSARWPAAYPPLTIAAIGDLHAGAPFIDLDQVARIVERTNAQKPDLIVLLGDYVIQRVPGGRRIPIEPIAAALAKLAAPLGVVAVLGNHDWWESGEHIRAAFEQVGITVLENAVTRRELQGHGFWLLGLGDAMTRPVSFAALAQTAGAPTIVLAHNPEPFATMPPGPVILLAAHTHGGQVRLPLIGSLIHTRGIPRRWMAGHIVEDGKEMFVTTGIGTSIMPVRFLTPPVIDVLTIETKR